jgi:hypothetical protein
MPAEELRLSETESREREGERDLGLSHMGLALRVCETLFSPLRLRGVETEGGRRSSMPTPLCGGRMSIGRLRKKSRTGGAASSLDDSTRRAGTGATGGTGGERTSDGVELSSAGSGGSTEANGGWGLTTEPIENGANERRQTDRFHMVVAVGIVAMGSRGRLLRRLRSSTGAGTVGEYDGRRGLRGIDGRPENLLDAADWPSMTMSSAS